MPLAAASCRTVEYSAAVQQSFTELFFPALNSLVDKVTIVTIWGVLQHALLNQPVVQHNWCRKIMKVRFVTMCLVKNVNVIFLILQQTEVRDLSCCVMSQYCSKFFKQQWFFYSGEWGYKTYPEIDQHVEFM